VDHFSQSLKIIVDVVFEELVAFDEIIMEIVNSTFQASQKRCVSSA
jgi:hypothetical protein